MGWVQGTWHGIEDVESNTWLAWAAWAALALGVAALIFTYRQLERNRALAAEKTRPYVAMLMEPHVADWHVIELVVRNFGRTAAYDIRFNFPNPPTVAEWLRRTTTARMGIGSFSTTGSLGVWASPRRTTT